MGWFGWTLTFLGLALLALAVLALLALRLWRAGKALAGDLSHATEQLALLGSVSYPSDAP